MDLNVQALAWRDDYANNRVHEVLAKAATENLTTTQVMSQLCDEEKSSRMRSAIAAKVKAARFPEINTIDGFNFDFDPARKKLKGRYLRLHDAAFIKNGINPLFIGLPGTGKTYLARSRLACLSGQSSSRFRQRRAHAQ